MREDNFEELMQPVPAKLDKPHAIPCKRKVIVGRKVKLCNDPNGSSVCGHCSNHCQDGRCEIHS